MADRSAAAKAEKPLPDYPGDYGYVFVLLGNIKEISCDCWLGASGAALDARSLPDFPSESYETEVNLVENEMGSRGRDLGRMWTYDPWPVERPRPYTVTLKGSYRGNTQKYIDEVEKYVRIAARQCRERGTRKMRRNVCPLLATVLLGTGFGGNYRGTGALVKRLLPVLYSLANELKVDIAIVTIEEEVYALTNSVKKQFLEEQTPESSLAKTIIGTRYLAAALIDKIRFLAKQAMRGELTLFVGAGASMGAGMPSWNDLLTDIAAAVGLKGDDFEEFLTLDYYTKAAILEARLKRENIIHDAAEKEEAEQLLFEDPTRLFNGKEGSTWSLGTLMRTISGTMQTPIKTDAVPDAPCEEVGKSSSSKESREQFGSGAGAGAGAGPLKPPKVPVQAEKNNTTVIPPQRMRTLGQHVARATRSSYYSIVDALLTALPCKEIITTNYDDLIEKAWKYTGPVSVLPYNPIQGCKRWLLKMHGTVDHPDEIVLSKKDYMRYHDRFAAMAGILQSTLMTRHLLFVGFSLDDDNFQRIFDSVRKARHPVSTGQSVSTSETAAEYSDFLHMKKFLRAKMHSRGMSGGVGADKRKVRYRAQGGYANAIGTAEEIESEYDDDDDPTAGGMSLTGACGTALLLEYSLLKGELWDGDIDIAYMEERADKVKNGTGAEVAPILGMRRTAEGRMDRLARLQEIFLDILGSRCSQNGHIKFLMNDRYVDALSASELEFKDCLLQFQRTLQNMSEGGKECRAHQYFQKQMQNMGFF